MSMYEGITEGDFGKSTKKRLPICFCLDVSGSMISPMANGGTRIGELNRAYDRFITTMKNNAEVAKSADIAIVTFGGKVDIVKQFASLEKQEFTEIQVNNRSFTPMGDGISVALQLLEKRKEAYKLRGIKYFQPWLVVITDGEPEGPNAAENYEMALQRVNMLEQQNKLVVFNIAIGTDCNFSNLKRLSCKNSEPIYVSESNDFNKFFKYLGSSSSSIISGQSTENDIINNRTLPKGEKMDISKFL